MKVDSRKPQAQRKQAAGPRIVRAWFDTVINPLLSGLNEERSLLLRGNWTWQFRGGVLESIRPAAHYAPSQAKENLEQFLAFYSSIKELTERHDRGVAALEHACFRLHTALVNRSPLPRLYEQLTSPASLRSISEVFGGYAPADHVAVLAQYVINNTGELPDHYTTAPFWNQHRDKFLSVLSTPDVGKQNKETNSAGARLRQITNELIVKLQEVRLGLSVKHDVPYVDPGSIRRSEGPWQY